jgi:hypothetical protein
MKMQTTKLILTAAALAGATALSGCGPEYDPLTRDGVWSPQHISRANLVLMAANPQDLVRGTGEAGSDGNLAAAAIDRLETNKLKKLPQAGLSDISVKSQGGE